MYELKLVLYILKAIKITQNITTVLGKRINLKKLLANIKNNNIAYKLCTFSSLS